MATIENLDRENYASSFIHFCRRWIISFSIRDAEEGSELGLIGETWSVADRGRAWRGGWWMKNNASDPGSTINHCLAFQALSPSLCICFAKEVEVCTKFVEVLGFLFFALRQTKLKFGQDFETWSCCLCCWTLCWCRSLFEWQLWWWFIQAPHWPITT